MKSVAELEKELAEAKRREKLEKEHCPACQDKGWICDSTYDRCGVDVSCDACHGSGLSRSKVAEIIRNAFAPYRKVVGERKLTGYELAETGWDRAGDNSPTGVDW